MDDNVKFGVTNVKFGVANACYAVMNDGTYSELHELGDAMSFDIEPSDEDVSVWAELLAKLPICETFTFRVEWWSINRFCKVIGERPPFTIRRLRRGGKSHRK